MHNIKRLILFAGDILQDCRKVFEDVHDDFCNIQNILLKFQQWREKFPDSYCEAFVGLCIPKLLNPLIRVQLLAWNPLKVFILNMCFLNFLVFRLAVKHLIFNIRAKMYSLGTVAWNLCSASTFFFSCFPLHF
jgi:hypothetical protein